MLLLELSIKTVSGNDVVTYFETGQGSKYILSNKNESKRIKSLHANTGAGDMGLKAWFQHCIFVSEQYQYEANAPLQLTNKGFSTSDLYLSMDQKQAAFYAKLDGKFRLLTWDDAYPKSNKGGKPLAFPYTSQPTQGFNVVEFNMNADKSLSNYHFGSEVTTIKPISQLSQQELMAFKG